MTAKPLQPGQQIGGSALYGRLSRPDGYTGRRRRAPAPPHHTPAPPAPADTRPAPLPVGRWQQ